MIKELITINVVMSAIVQACKNKIMLNNIHGHLKLSMNFFGEGEPMHNHESGWEEEALENCGGAVHVRRNIIPKSLTLFYTKKCDFPYSVLFQVKTGEILSTIFRPKGV